MNNNANNSNSTNNGIRIDKWLWAARFFKTRSLASHAIDLGRILQNELRVKPAHSVKVGDVLQIEKDEQTWTIEVLLLLDNRGSATIAQTMYQETAESQQLRQLSAEKRRLEPEPSAQIQRQTKRQRRQLISLRDEF